MKRLIAILFLQVSVSFGQNEKICFEHFDPLSYGVGERISFSDSTFTYEFVEGLAGGVVKGEYIKSGDSIILTSEYQQDNYILRKSIDSTISRERIELKIKLIEYTQVIEVRNKDKKDSITIFEGKTVWRSNLDPINEDVDTMIISYDINLEKNDLRNFEVIIWRKNSVIRIPVEQHCNAYFLDLTNYPSTLDYRFFNNKYSLIHKNEFFFLDDNRNPETDFYPIRTRKGITISKKKKITTYKKCT